LSFTFGVREIAIRLNGMDKCGPDLVQGSINALHPTYSSLTKYNPDDFDLWDSVLTQSFCLEALKMSMNSHYTMQECFLGFFEEELR
jgi:hypothetical protein